jgi:hypothetical protein
MEAPTHININQSNDYGFTLNGVDFSSLVQALDFAPYEIANPIIQTFTQELFNGQNKVNVDITKNYKVHFKGYQLIAVDKAIQKINYKNALPLLEALKAQLIEIKSTEQSHIKNIPQQPEHPFINAAKENNLPG